MWTNATILVATAVAAVLNETDSQLSKAANRLPWWVEEVVGGVVAVVVVVVALAILVRRKVIALEGLLQGIHSAAHRVARAFTRAEQQPPANSSATFPMGLVGVDPFPRVPHYLTDDMRIEMEQRRQQLQHLYEQGCQGNRAAWV